MKNIVLLLCLVASGALHAQGLLSKVKSAVRQSSEEVILEKAREETTSGLDSALTKRPAAKPHSGGKAARATDPSDVVATDTVKSNGAQLYSKFDFTPGEQVIYFTDFSEDSVGELPPGWNTNGSGEVVARRDQSGHWLKLNQSSAFLSDNEQPFAETFSVEFDVFFTELGTEIINFPAFYFGFLASGTRNPGDNALLNMPEEDFLARVYLGLIADGSGNSIVQLETFEAASQYFDSGLKSVPKLEQFMQGPIHISIQVLKRRLRVWINEDKVFDAPNAIADSHALNQLYFQIGDSGFADDQVGLYLTNIKIANGVPDLKGTLLESGAFSTSAIRFDTNKATIRPESYGVLNELGKLLRSNQTLHLAVIGHTDNVGNDRDNQTLSERRADAIARFFTEAYRIPSSRLTPSGKGSQSPVADNGSAVGRAANRRVEFVVLHK